MIASSSVLKKSPKKGPYSGTLDTGHFFNTSLAQCLVFLGILQGQESKI